MATGEQTSEEAQAFLGAVREAAYDSGAKAAREEIAGARGRGEVPPKVLDELRRPFAPEAVKWKVQSEWGTGAVIVAHIDARLVIERLNLVVGMNWSDDFTVLGSGFMWCALTVAGVTRHDVGKGDDAKAAVSDARKRAGVAFGIGVSIYALAAVRMNVGAGPGRLRTEKKNKKQRDGSFKKVDVCVLDALNLEKLADSYSKWLTGKGAVFGEALPHGDQEGAMGLELDVDPAEPEEPVDDVIQAEGEQADEWRQRAKDAYETLRERGELLPGEFNRRLTAAGGSLEELEAFADELVEQAAREPEAKS